eukprot:jgi/Chlat1/4666/Chrsp3S05608
MQNVARHPGVYLQDVRLKSAQEGGPQVEWSESASSDFVYDEGTVQHIAKPLEFLQQHASDFAPYCIDFKAERLLLVRVKDAASLRSHPFFYHAQRTDATQVLVMPLADATSVVEALQKQQTGITVVHLYNISRCGSTVLCQALDACAGVQSLSEPDAYLNCISLPHEVITPWLRAVTVLLNNFCIASRPQAPLIVYKHRSEIMAIVGAVQAATPAKGIFLYRQCLPWCESWMRIFFYNRYWVYYLYSSLRWNVKTDGFLLESQDTPLGPHEESLRDVTRTYGTIGFLVAAWLSRINSGVGASKKGLFSSCVSYEDLLQRRTEVVRQVLENLGKQVSEGDALAMASALKKESQAGTRHQSHRRGARSGWFGGWEQTRMQRVFNAYGAAKVDQALLYLDQQCRECKT